VFTFRILYVSYNCGVEYVLNRNFYRFKNIYSEKSYQKPVYKEFYNVAVEVQYVVEVDGQC